MRYDKPCEHCGKIMSVVPSDMTRKRFCSRSCFGHSKVAHLNAVRKTPTENAGWFTPGFEPWNKGLNVHLSPATEIKPGQHLKPYVPIGTERVRIDKNDKPRTFVKVADPDVWKLRCVVNWEAVYGSVPKGLLLHHKDRDTLNDSVDNLEPLTRAQHLAEHRSEQNRPDTPWKRLQSLNSQIRELKSSCR